MKALMFMNVISAHVRIFGVHFLRNAINRGILNCFDVKEASA
jgi:hypothetical protein